LLPLITVGDKSNTLSWAIYRVVIPHPSGGADLARAPIPSKRLCGQQTNGVLYGTNIFPIFKLKIDNH
jgi:hypothetical protein